ncbi:hypothetical protein AYO40_01100 [Planctomycetaceae bacterium SCGC AG-212-D15]|nr:hypothetical protein AYO40_01100 [Planctomycetaceae bacterium SCGC AG-212-D15]
MDAQKASLLFLVVVAAVIGIYDIYAVLFLPCGHTVSKLFLEMSQKYPIIPFALGVLIGHTIWPND